MSMKSTLCLAAGVTGGFFATLFGGWDAGMITLLIFMGIDFFSGLTVALVFKKSPKTETGAAESKVGFKGICRKCLILLFVLIAERLDIMIGTSYIRDAVIIGFCVNELISIIENAGLMGIPIPKVIINAIEVLKQKGDDKNE